MSPKKKPKLKPPTFRSELVRRAKDIGVSSEDLDRALIIGQLAGLLVRDPDLKGKLAHKGAAVLRLIDKSERLSRDLDSAEIRGQRIEGRVVVRALSTAVARRVVLKVQPNRPSKTSVSFLAECRRLTGGATMAIALTINWSDPFMLPAVMAGYALPDGTPIKTPVMQGVERASEKVRTFLTRGEAADAYDLWWYWNRVLKPADLPKLPNLIEKKADRAIPPILGGEDLHGRFDDMRKNARQEWESNRGLVIAGTKPAWKDVDAALLQFKGRTPRK